MMPSIVNGFEYDIFISYRHNDNRSGWVTAFVSALQEELAATIKEPLSIYFDSNPYDGLLETHHVDKSLEGKLKCLIFIPIISQTYCDPKSFAWQNEFCAFNKLSKIDSFGRDVKLNNGNVASRILPVKIHDLDEYDKSFIENELGGVLRSIEFIYKEPGVNRPLSSTDKKNDNQNKTDYRNQVNKLANAIKEITYGVIKPSAGGIAGKPQQFKVKEYTDTKPSIVVLPFTNLSSNAEQEYFSDGISENIIMELASNKGLRTISRTSAMRYKKTTKTAPEIGEELGVQYILEGGVQVHGNKVRINVQLVDAEKDDLTWSKVFIENMDDIFELQSQVAKTVANELQASIGVDDEPKTEQAPTRNLEAYDLFLKGRHAFNQWSVEGYKVASEYFKKAIALDPEFKLAYSSLASSYSARMSWNGDLTTTEALVNIEKYLSEAWRRGPSDNDYLTKAFVEFFIAKNFLTAEQYLLNAIELGPNNAAILYTYSYLLNMMGRFEEAQHYVDKAKLIEPLTVAYFNFQTITLHLMNRNEEALNTIKEGLRLYPSVLRFYDFLARIYIVLEKWEEAEDAVNTGLRMSAIRPPSMVASLCIAYNSLNKKDKSKTLLEELIKRSENEEREVNINIAYVFSAENNLPLATTWFTKAKETNDVGLIWWQVDPLLKKIRPLLQQNNNSVDFEGAEKHITELLERNMPKHAYHNIDHVNDVLNAVLQIGKAEQVSEEETKLLRLAALFHDAGFIYSPTHHEQRGAEMAQEILPTYGLNASQLTEISKMILATRIPQSPTTPLSKILCDADLDYLGREDFYDIGKKLFDELVTQGVVETEREWNLVQKTFLESHRYHTNYSKTNREASKQQRLQEIIAKLKNRS